MDKKLIVRLSNELGNQMFMYASSYSIAKKLNRLLLIDYRINQIEKRRRHVQKIFNY